MMSLPNFRYHPDPIRSGSIKEADTVCIVCGRPRGFVYTGPVYALEEYVDCICPWCIADGTAHDQLGAEFTDSALIGGGGIWEEVSEEIIAEIAHRTPGFAGWQQEQWFTCCGDGAAFLGVVGYKELKDFGPEAIMPLKTWLGLSGEEWDRFFRSLNKDGSPTAYLFQCLHCGRYGGYADFD
jgi:uncharacterized protein CbrC (UPF0167 family)